MRHKRNLQRNASEIALNSKNLSNIQHTGSSFQNNMTQNRNHLASKLSVQNLGQSTSSPYMYQNIKWKALIEITSFDYINDSSTQCEVYISRRHQMPPQVSNTKPEYVKVYKDGLHYEGTGKIG